MNKLFFAFFGILLIASSYAHAHGQTCGHDTVINHQPLVGMHHEDPTGHHRNLADWDTFRISAIYTDLFDAKNNVSSAHADYFKNTLVPAAINWMTAALKVKQYTSGLTWPYSNAQCGGDGFLVTIPDSMKGGKSMANTDLLLLVTGTYNPNASFVARAWSCASDSATGRTYLGGVQFNTYYMGVAETSWASNLATTLHEITHILFFSSNLFGSYYNPATNSSLTGHYTTKTIDGITTTVITHQKILDEARAHFGCNTMSYVRLENQGSSGSMGSHWERIWFGNEFMTASVGNRMPVSRLTLALAEVSGWYQANYNMAETMVWGKGRGCNFVDKQCLYGREADSKAEMKSYAPEFCTSPGKSGCNSEYTAHGYCATGIASKLPDIWNYFKDNTAVSDSFADNCPTVAGYSNRFCENPGASAMGDTFEYFGAGSACFMSSLAKQYYTPTNDGRCYQYTCTLDNTTKLYKLTVKVNGIDIPCDSEGQTITPKNIPDITQGDLTCPHPHNFCSLKVGYCPRGCGGAGTCNNGVCTCKSGRKGPDCLRTA